MSQLLCYLVWLQLCKGDSGEVIQCGSGGTIQFPAPLHDFVTRKGRREGREGGRGKKGEEGVAVLIKKLWWLIRKLELRQQSQWDSNDKLYAGHNVQDSQVMCCGIDCAVKSVNQSSSHNPPSTILWVFWTPLPVQMFWTPKLKAGLSW